MERAWRWKEDEGRLAFEDRFQYHEWTFKQAYISSSSAHSPASLQHHSYRLPFLTLWSSLHWLRLSSDVFPLDPRSVFSRAPYTRNCRAKLCAILNILINRVIPINTGKNKLYLPWQCQVALHVDVITYELLCSFRDPMRKNIKCLSWNLVNILRRNNETIIKLSIAIW